MKVTSTAFVNDGEIPAQYTCDGDQLSPPLTFRDIPADALSLALIVEDPDAHTGPRVHWLIWNIPTTKTGFSEGEKIAYPQGKNGSGASKYGGMCPQEGAHRYFFRLYALDSELDLQAGSTKKELETAMAGHIIEEALLVGRYSRKVLEEIKA